MESVSESVNVTYIVHPSGIHEYIAHNTSRLAIDEIIRQMDILMTNTPRGTVLRQLFDTRTGLASVTYAMQRGRELARKHRNPPQMRSAILYADNIVMSLFSPSLRLLRATNLQSGFFKGTERDEAIAWLLK